MYRSEALRSGNHTGHFTGNAAAPAAAPVLCLQFEWPATWCYMSVGQCFVALAMEGYSIYRQRQQAAVHSTVNGYVTANGLAKPMAATHYSAADLGVDAVAHGPDSVKGMKKTK